MNPEPMPQLDARREYGWLAEERLTQERHDRWIWLWISAGALVGLVGTLLAFAGGLR